MITCVIKFTSFFISQKFLIHLFLVSSHSRRLSTVYVHTEFTERVCEHVIRCESFRRLDGRFYERKGTHWWLTLFPVSKTESSINVDWEYIWKMRLPKRTSLTQFFFYFYSFFHLISENVARISSVPVVFHWDLKMLLMCDIYSFICFKNAKSIDSCRLIAFVRMWWENGNRQAYRYL